MTTYKYWSNKTKAHGELLAEIVASSILEADKFFEEKTGLNSVKFAWIGCEIVI